MLDDRDYMRNPQGGNRRPGGSGIVPSYLFDTMVKKIILACVVVFIFEGFSANSSVGEALKLHPYYFRTSLQPWRLVTYLFVHATFFHLLMNMWGLYIFGNFVERCLGPKRFLALFLISGIIGGILWLPFNWDLIDKVHDIYSGRTYYILGGCVGASGAVFGIIIAAAMIAPNQIIYLVLPPMPLRLKTMVIFYAIIEIIMAFDISGKGGRVAHLAHLGGILGGIFFMMRYPNFIRWNPLGFIFDRFSKAKVQYKQSQFRVVNQQPPKKNPPPTNASSRSLSSDIDKILDKIGRFGESSLTKEERETLNKESERLRKR